MLPATSVPAGSEDGRGPFPSLEHMERSHIELALDLTGGKVYGAGGAAELLDINPNTLRSRMKKLGLGGARSFRARS